MDTARLRENFAYVAMHGDEVALFFYSDLFLRHPELREMFPVSMAAQRDRLVRAIGKIVSDAGHLDQLAPYLRELGRATVAVTARAPWPTRAVAKLANWRTCARSATCTGRTCTPT